MDHKFQGNASNWDVSLESCLSRLPLLCLVMVMFLMGSSRLAAQATCSIVGTVRDASGAVVENSKVFARNVDTGFVRSVTTKSNGEYQIVALPVGTYTVTGESPDMKQVTAVKTTLQVGQKALIDISLVASAVASVVVTDTPTIMQTQDSSVGQVINNQQIVDLPLNGRHATQLVSLTPGASRSGYNGGPAGGSNTGFTTVSLSGGQSSKTEFILDGLSDTEGLYNGIQYEPSVDFIREFKVVSNSAAAQYGFGSGVVLMATKSGTNTIHGTVFEFIRLDTPGFQTSARNYFAAPGSPVAAFHQNQFGASFGGPMLKDKLFYFLNYEGTRISLPVTKTAVVPSAALRSATDPDLSTLIGTNTYSPTACSTNSATCLHNPFTGAAFPTNSSGHYYIPTNLLNGAAHYFLDPNIIPLPNQPDGIHYNWSPANTSSVNQGNARVDYQLNEKNSFFGRFSINDNSGYGSGLLPGTGGIASSTNAKNFAGGYTHLFTPNVLNELRLGGARLLYSNTAQGTGTNYTVNSGILGFATTSLDYPGFPLIAVGSSYAGVAGTTYSPLINETQTYEIRDTVTWDRKSHSFLFGVDARRFHLTSTNAAFSRGTFSFACNFSGNGFVDYLMGLPCSGTRDFARNIFGERFFNIPMFAQDDWRLTHTMTLNLGLRYDFALAPRQDLYQNAYFDIANGRYIVSVQPDGTPNLKTQRVAQAAYNAYSGIIVTAAKAGLPNNLETISKRTFAPRVGFAQRLFGREDAVLRGGYGIFYDLPYGNASVSESIINLPFIVDSSQAGATCLVRNPCTISSTTPNTENFFNYPYATAGLGFPLISQSDLNIRPPYNQEWNLAIQQGVAHSTSFQIAYVGNKGTHLERVLPLNYATFGTAPLQSRRPQPAFGAGNNYTHISNSIYHALQTTFEHRSTSGLYLLSAFTWGKLIDDTNIDGATTTQNPYNLSQDRGLGNFDIKLRWVNSIVYQLPFGRGKQFGSHIPHALDYVAGGWKVSAIGQMQSGVPFTVTESTDPLNSGRAYGIAPIRVGSGLVANPSIKQWFDYTPTSFLINPTASGVYGNSGRNILRGPGSQNWDSSLMKAFHFTSRSYAELRLDAFNVLNHPQFGLPNANIQAGTGIAGAITTTATSTNSRELQGAIKIYF